MVNDIINLVISSFLPRKIKLNYNAKEVKEERYVRK